MIDWQTDDEIIDNLNEKISTLKAKLEEKDAEINHWMKKSRKEYDEAQQNENNVWKIAEKLKAKLEKAEAALEKLISAVEMVPFRDVYQDINEAKEALKELRGERAR
jgi:uncharacterized protein (DUF3084 family)